MPDKGSRADTNGGAPFVVVDHLGVQFRLGAGLLSARRQVVHAVDDVSFTIAKVETVGLVGESGSGKTTVGRVLAGLSRPTSGSAYAGGVNVHGLRGRALRRFRRRVQVVFQDPFSSLNPRMSVLALVGEPIRRYGLRSKRRQNERVVELLTLVGLSRGLAERRPGSLSGGQRQRVAIARALAAEPELLILDEPVSALDVSVRAQVLNLLVELRGSLGLTCLFIAHDLSIVRWISDRVFVMYHGKIVESGPVVPLFSTPRHPYTRALLSAIPIPDPKLERRRGRIVLPGEILSAAESPVGCDFAERCWLTRQLDYPSVCTEVKPPLIAIDVEHASACHFASNLQEPVVPSNAG